MKKEEFQEWLAESFKRRKPYIRWYHHLFLWLFPTHTKIEEDIDNLFIMRYKIVFGVIYIFSTKLRNKQAKREEKVI